MKRAAWIVIIAVSSVVVAFVALAVGFAMYKSFAAEKVGWDSPLSRTEALNGLERIQIEYPFPQSARDIYLHQRREGTQQNFVYVRFSVDPREVDQHVQQASLAYRVAFPRDSVHNAAIPDTSSPRVSWFPRPPSWWQPSSIKHGRVITFGRDFGPVFWFDATHNILYHYEVD